jgi:YVTN family beta-propeller protein
MILTTLLAVALAAPVQERAPEPVAPPLSGTLLVLNKSDATLDLVDAETGRRFHTSPTGNGPHEVAVSPDGKLAVVCDYGEQVPGRTLTVLDLDAREVVRTIDLGEYRRPHGIEFEDAGHVIVPVEQAKAILRVDVAAGAVLAAFPTEQDASHMVVVEPVLRRAFVANIASGSVTAIDLAEGVLLKQIPTGAGAEGIALTPDGKEVWVGNRAADTLSVIDARSLEVLAELPCAAFPIRVEITPDGRRALVSNANSGEVVAFDVATRAVLARVPMKVEAVATEDRVFQQFGASPVPVGIQIDPKGRRAYVACTNADLVTEIDLATWTVVRRIATGRQPDGMAWVARRLYEPGNDG